VLISLLFKCPYFSVDFWRIKFGGEFGTSEFFQLIFGGQKFGGEFGYRRRLGGLSL